MEPDSLRQKGIPFDIWRTSGTTEHLGGISATQRLLELCHIVPGQTVLDLGCGTGYTACLLAQAHQTRVIGVDIHPSSLAEARQRVVKAGAGSHVHLIQADAHHLPYASGAFDLVIAESVLVFCQALQVATEICRVLRPGGTFGANELTILQPPPEELISLLQGTLGIRSFEPSGWHSLLENAGFVDVLSTAHRFRWREQLASHIQVDGLRGYLAAMVKGLGNLRLSRTFINREMLRAARQFTPLIGYGLYTARKASS